MRTLEEFEAVRSAVDVPLLANMTEFGKSDLFTHDQLRDVGIDLVIHPVSLLRSAMGAAEDALDELARTGTLAGVVPRMQTRARLYELLDYAAYNTFDDRIFTYGRDTTP
jgi:methylisocitrate lyase